MSGHSASALSAAEATTFLFVPGDRPDRFAKASASGADVVVVDLEDAVPREQKSDARSAVDAYLTGGGRVAVRINAAGTVEHEADAAMVTRHNCPVMLPKAATTEAVEQFGPCPVIALVETAAGVLAAPDLARSRAVVRLALGHLDLAAELGVDPDDRDALRAVRTTLVLASAAAGLAGPVDGVTTNVQDETRLRDDVDHARRLGLTGKLCIHPRQVAASTAAFIPDEETLAWAERVTRAGATASVALVDGRMVDRPVIERARRLLALAERRARQPLREDPS